MLMRRAPEWRRPSMSMQEAGGAIEWHSCAILSESPGGIAFGRGSKNAAPINPHS